MSNLITATRKWRSKALLVKTELAYGDDAIPTGAANWIEARNVQLTPMDTDKVQRNIDLPYKGNAGTILVGFWTKLSFDVAMAPSGIVATPPKWGPLMMACGTAETIVAATSVVYNLVSANYSSVTGYMNIAGVVHKLQGMRGTVKGKISAKGTPMLSYSFDGVYATPLVGVLPTVTRTGWAVEEGVNSTNTGPATINGIPLAYSTLDWDFGNKIGRIDLPGPQREITITDGAPTASLTVLAPDLPTFNPFALAEAATVIPVSTVHGSAAGRKIKTDIQARIIGVEYDQIEGNAAYKLMLDPVPVAGNDEIALTCL